VPRNQEEHRKNSARESFDEHRILNAKSTSPEFLAATVHELSTKSSRNAAISTTTTIMATLSAIFLAVACNSANPATTANSRNLATTT
jgi:cell division protein FtsX